MGMNERFRAALAGQVRIENIVKTILQSHGVMPALNHFYMAFGKKAVKLKERFAGPTLTDELGALDQHWSSRGLDANILGLIKAALVPGYVVCGPFRLDVSLLDGCDYLV